MTTATERLTNTQIAEALGMSPSGVSRLRSGTRRPKPECIERILDVYVANDPELRWVGLEALVHGGEMQKRFFARIWGIA